VTIKMTTSGQP